MNISTLVPDIQKLIVRKDGWFTHELSSTFGAEVGARLQEQLGGSARTPTLRLSQMGPRCPKALWYSIHEPGLAETLPPWAEVKYTFGHIIEALAITLAKAAGHEVTGEQDELIVDGIKGHRDCVIDGCVVDVKSSSSFGFNKFKDGSLKDNDSFGYLDQLDGYVVGSFQDPLVRVKDKGYILAIDKTLGHMALYEHVIRNEHILNRIRESKEIVARSEPPACRCGTVPDGKSGNIRLDTRASYSAQKWTCNPNLRCFLYAPGPVYLTKVVRTPDVVEIDKAGKIVYH